MPKKVEKTPEEKKEKHIFTSGKRKRAVARAVLKKGKGIIKINSKSLENIENEIVRMKIMEPLLIVGEKSKTYDISVNVKGGGIMAQADAARLAIGKGLSQSLGSEIKKKLLDYDRNLLVSDMRRTEPHKPPHSSWGARRYKQRSKR